ncbi:MAG: DNA polymerase beta domain protein region [Elusimicrobia bacterium]|nr:MAG: DNA polymerase beta domain protein region [Elusimicrobiota bacterium]
MYLFGSWAAGKSRKNSDADVAVLLSPATAKKAFKLQMCWQEELARILGIDVDLVILNEADPLLKFQVYSKGLPAYIKTPASAEKLKWRAIGEYWDWIPSQRILEKIALARMGKY